MQLRFLPTYIRPIRRPGQLLVRLVVASMAALTLSLLPSPFPAPGQDARAAHSSVFAASGGISLSRSSIAFGQQAVGSTSTPTTITLTNRQTAPISLPSITTAGDFVATHNCGASLPPNGRCTITVTFAPAALGLRTGALTVAHSGNNSPLTATLKGTGVQAVELSKTSLSFGSRLLGTTSDTKTIVLTNNQDVDLGLLGIVTTGDFAQTNNCGTRVPARGKCSIGVTFAPTVVGTRSGVLAVGHDAPAPTQPLTLSGTGNVNGLKTLTVAPGGPSIPLGTSQRFRVAASFKNGTSADFTAFVTWSSQDSAVASISNSAGSQGLATSTGAGSTTIRAALGTVEGLATLTVTPRLLVSIAVTPTVSSIEAGQTQQFTALGTYTDSSTQDISASAAWNSSDPGVATVDAAGNATAVVEGDTNISAAAGAISGSATLTVTPARRFTPTGSMSSARTLHTATLLNDGTVLIAGGESFGLGTLTTAERYDPRAEAFVTTGGMNRPRACHSATLLNSGQVLIAGGAGGAVPDSSAEIYDPASGTFTSTGNTISPRFCHTATLLANGMVLIAGGFDDSGTKAATAELYEPATGTFSPAGRMTSRRAYHTATLLNNGKVLITGGRDVQSALISAEVYDPATRSFTASGSMTDYRYHHTASLLNDGKVLIAGGDAGPVHASAELYDPATGTFTATGSMLRARYFQTCTLLHNGQVLVAGGDTGLAYLASAELYDPATASFTAAGNMASDRELHTITLLNDGTVLIAGGRSGSSELASAELFTPTTLTPPGLVSITVSPTDATVSPGATQKFVASGTFSDHSTRALAAVAWNASDPAVAEITSDAGSRGVASATAPGSTTITASAGALSGATILTVRPTGFVPTDDMTTTRGHHTATRLNDGRVLLAGGVLNDGAELYDPSTGTFRATGSMTSARSEPTATLLGDGKVLIAGGAHEGYLASAELYDPATGTFTATGTMTSPRYRHTATLLRSGKVLIAGGWIGGPYLDGAELYDPATGTFSATSSMASNRGSHSATLLKDGTVLIAGGGSSDGVLAAAELYDPGTGTFSSTGSMSAGRAYQTATLLKDGRVLIPGGSFGGDSAELYDPGSGSFTSTGRMAGTRYWNTATLLNNGEVLIAGGYDGDYLDTAELYDPAAGTFRAAGSMTSRRGWHTATLLENGMVLIAGGVAQGYLAGAELY